MGKTMGQVDRKLCNGAIFLGLDWVAIIDSFG